MLFDLQKPSRRRIIKVTYAILAVLMAGGLVLFGVGTGGLGGLVDSFNGSSGGESVNKQLEKDEKKFEDRIAKNPKDAEALIELTKTRVELAGQGSNFDINVDSTSGEPQGGSYTDNGYKELQQAQETWNKYLALKPKKPDSGLAQTMAGALGIDGLWDFQAALEAQMIVTEARPSAGSYQALALSASFAGSQRIAELAAAKAVALAPKSDRKQLKSDIADQQQQITQFVLTQQFTQQDTTQFAFETQSPLAAAGVPPTQ